MCMMSLLMYSAAKDVAAMNVGMYANMLCGNLAGICVSLYHVSACRFGFQHMALLLGPNAIHLAMSHAHMDADIANIILIVFCNMRLIRLFDLNI